jgi:hypothetical protein
MNATFVVRILQKLLMLSLPMPKGKKNMFGALGVSTRLMGALVMTHSDDQD